jgi:hypothetical protein
MTAVTVPARSESLQIATLPVTSNYTPAVGDICYVVFYYGDIYSASCILRISDYDATSGGGYVNDVRRDLQTISTNSPLNSNRLDGVELRKSSIGLNQGNFKVAFLVNGGFSSATNVFIQVMPLSLNHGS